MRNTRQILLFLLVLLLLLLLSGRVWASGSQAYSMDRYVLSAGGAQASSTSGHVSLNGTLGQTATGASTHGQNTLWAGFWQRLQQVMWNLFLPILTNIK